jgi:hypothetical protein
LSLGDVSAPRACHLRREPHGRLQSAQAPASPVATRARLGGLAGRLGLDRGTAQGAASLVMTSRQERGKGHTGWRSTIRSWLVEHGMSPEDADVWLDEWDRTHVDHGSHRDTREYWDDCVGWIIEQRKTRKLPT